MYSQDLGEAYNYGQSGQPGKGRQGRSGFMQYQYDNFGAPGNPQQNKPQSQGQPQQAPQQAPTFNPLPTGQPTVAQNQQQPVQYINPVFQAPQTGGLDHQQGRLVSQLLGGGPLQGYGIGQAQGQAKDQQALMQKQQLSQASGNAKSRGLSGPYVNSLQNAIRGQGQKDLLNQYQQIQTNGRANAIGALGAADNFQNNQLQRAITPWQANINQSNFLDQLAMQYQVNNQNQQNQWMQMLMNGGGA